MSALVWTLNPEGNIDVILTEMNSKQVTTEWIEIFDSNLDCCHTIYCARKKWKMNNNVIGKPT